MRLRLIAFTALACLAVAACTSPDAPPVNPTPNPQPTAEPDPCPQGDQPTLCPDGVIRDRVAT